MGGRRWEFLPFIGGSDGDHEGNVLKSTVEAARERARGREKSKREKNDEPLDPGLTKQQSTAMYFRDMDEEYIVQDYNSPIHMWVSWNPRIMC